MFNKINNSFDINQDLLNLYTKRQEIIASNIANANTPNYKSVDIDFKEEINKILNQEKIKNSSMILNKTSKNHLDGMLYQRNKLHIKPVKTYHKSLNGNTVDMNRERIEFIHNSLKYEEQLIFLKNKIKNIMNVLKG